MISSPWSAGTRPGTPPPPRGCACEKLQHYFFKDQYLYLFSSINLLKSVNSVNILLCEVCSASAKDFLVLLKAIIPGDKCKNVTHDLICLLASLMENLRLVLCTARPSRPITTMLGFSTLRLSSGNTRQH